ncbi:MAG: hypothetical protein EXQ55_08860 [Acidobacteria bacterium]|nr:hypothetical protein [Acidobacteriota bacterium]
MTPHLETAGWSGEGAFTQLVIERLCALAHVAAARVEDAPATRSEADYNFITNEIFLTFTTSEREEPIRRLGIFPGTRRVAEKTLTLAGLEQILAEFSDIGPPDYADEGMIQYLRTERIVPPYQTKGYKLVELLRIYEVGSPSRA